MDKVIAFTHKYGYVAMEELAFRIIPLAFLYNWLGVVLISGIAFGLCHWHFSWLAALGSLGAGLMMGWLYVFAIPYPFNIIVVVGIHLAWAKWGLK